MGIKTRVLLAGTIPSQNNGYSKVVYELSKKLADYKDIDLHIFGFQKFAEDANHDLERKLPDNVTVYDVYANEEPKKTGFGDDLIQDYIKTFKPHMVIVYNDLVVLYRLIKKMQEMPDKDKTFKIVPYVDIVYKNEKNALIKFLEDSCDGAIMFTEYWKTVIREQGFTKPIHIVEHGFNKMGYFPIPKEVARDYFNLDQNDFIILNLNRNQPRKRWDTCLQAYIKFISTHQDDPIKLLIGTNIQGSWDLIDIFVSECRKYNMDPEVAKKHLIIMNSPQKLTDKDINILYNCADVGLNTAEGEGFGLCNFEHAAIGIPQVIPNVGGFKDFFTLDNSFIIDPKWSYYSDNSRDIVSGEAEVCDIADIVNMMDHAYRNKDKLAKFGKKARKLIVEKYKWEDKAKQLYDCIIYHTKDLSKAPLDKDSEKKLNDKKVDTKEPSIKAQNKTLLKNIEVYDGTGDSDDEDDKKIVDIDSKPVIAEKQVVEDKNASKKMNIMLSKKSLTDLKNDSEEKIDINIKNEIKKKLKEINQPGGNETITNIPDAPLSEKSEPKEVKNEVIDEEPIIQDSGIETIDEEPETLKEKGESVSNTDIAAEKPAVDNEITTSATDKAEIDEKSAVDSEEASKEDVSFEFKKLMEMQEQLNMMMELMKKKNNL